MALPRFVHLTSDLRAFASAAWQAFRAFATGLRAPSRSELPSPTFVLETDGLPHSYGRTRLVVLAVDPYAVHAYWEVTPGSLMQAACGLDDSISRAQPVLRFQDTSITEPIEGEHHPAFDVDIRLDAGNWYVPLWSSGKSYDVRLGLKTRSEKFVPLAGVTKVDLPKAWPERAVEEHFMQVSEEDRRAEIVPAPEPEYHKPARLEPATEVEAVPMPVAYGVIALPEPPAVFSRTLIFEGFEPERFEPGSQPPSERVHAPRETLFRASESPAVVHVLDLAEVAEQRFIPGISSIIPEAKP